MEALVYAANILYLLSYTVRDILHLRVLTIVAACCLVSYFYNQAEPLMTVVYWNVFFVALNALQPGTWPVGCARPISSMAFYC
jgi:hypothetical protein